MTTDLTAMQQLLEDGSFERWEDAYHELHELGRRGDPDTVRPIAERYLSSPHPELRWIALEVLTAHFHQKRHAETAKRFLLEDPDVEVRFRAASALGSLFRNTGDRDTLRTLARIVRDESEPSILRETAYRAMRKIVHDDPREQLNLAAHGPKEPGGIDWKFVDTYR